MSSASEPARRVLVVLTRTVDPLADIVTPALRALPGTEIEVVDLTESAPDYGRLLESIFQADSVQVW